VSSGINRLSRHKEISKVRPAGRTFTLFHDPIDTAAHLLGVVTKARKPRGLRRQSNYSQQEGDQMNKYFTLAPETLEELKAMYRKLAMLHHPDRGGSEEAMKAVNNEYDVLFPKLRDVHRTREGKTYTARQASTETADQFKDLIDKLMKMDNITIEVIGCFVWVTGDTWPNRGQLKALKFQWHSKKIAWYLAPEDYRKRSRREYGLDEIRSMYGSSGAVNSRGMVKIDGAESA